jgi:plastocyanin
MSTALRSRITSIALIAACAVVLGPSTAETQPKKPRYATQADLERVEKKLDEQRALVTRLIKLQQQYLQSLVALTGEGTVPAEPPPEPPPITAKPDEPKPVRPAPVVVAPRPPAKPAFGTIVGKVKGGGGEAVVYLDIQAPPVRATAAMKQQNRQFLPRVLVVQKGTQVDFPNMDTVFHNVFSVTPASSFDLGSYRQGESKSVTLSKPGVVTVYCNMHPQMVGHVLVVPSSHYARTGKDGFYKIANVPAGKHKIVAWAPNAKPVSSQVEVLDSEAATVELEVVRRGSQPHTNKDGLPYGSYKD